MNTMNKMTKTAMLCLCLFIAPLSGCIRGFVQADPEEWTEVEYEGGLRNRLDELLAGMDPDGKRMTGGRVAESFGQYRQRILQEWFDRRPIGQEENPNSAIRALGCDDFSESDVYGFFDCLYVKRRLMTAKRKSASGTEPVVRGQFSRTTYIRLVARPKSSNSEPDRRVKVHVYDAEDEQYVRRGDKEDFTASAERRGWLLFSKFAALAHLNATDHRERTEKFLGLRLVKRESAPHATFSSTSNAGADSLQLSHTAVTRPISEQIGKKGDAGGPRRASFGAKLDAAKVCVTPEMLSAKFPGASIKQGLVIRDHPRSSERESSWDSVFVIDPTEKRADVGATFAYRRCAQDIGLIQYLLSTGEK